MKLSDKIECDDGNLIDGDGCDANCDIETHFACRVDNTTRKSFCWDDRPFTYEIRNVPDKDYEFRLLFSKEP